MIINHQFVQELDANVRILAIIPSCKGEYSDISGSISLRRKKNIATSFQLYMELMSIFIASCVCALVPIFHLLHSFETFIKISFPSFSCVSVLSSFNGMIMFYKKECSIYGYVKIRNLFTCAFLHPFSKYLVHHLPLSLSSVFSNHFYKKKVLFQHIGYKLEGPSAI